MCNNTHENMMTASLMYVENVAKGSNLLCNKLDIKQMIVNKLHASLQVVMIACMFITN